MTESQIIVDLDLIVVQATWRATWVMLEVADDAGRRGLAESSGPATFDGIREQLRAVKSRLLGLTVTAARSATGAPGPGNPLQHALDLALADLDAQDRGSVLDLLPPERYRARVPLYANINRAERDRTPAKLAALGERAAADGFAAVKLAPFDGTDADHGMAHLRALRAAIGPDIELMVDCHERLPLDETLRLLPELEALSVIWLEDALPMGDLDGWRTLSAATRIPLAAGEQATALADVEPLLRAGLLSHVLPDVQVAGVGGCHRILTAALGSGVGASLHNPTGPVGTAASLLVAAAVPEFGRLEFAYGEVPWRGELLVPAEEILSDASLAVPAGFGLGVGLSDRGRRHQ